MPMSPAQVWKAGPRAQPLLRSSGQTSRSHPWVRETSSNPPALSLGGPLTRGDGGATRGCGS